MSKELCDIASFVLGLAKEKGAQKAFCSISESEEKEFNVDGGTFSLFRTLFDRSVSLTVFKDDKKGSVSVNKFDEDSLCHLADNAVRAAESSNPDTSWEIAENIGKREFSEGCFECDTDRLFDRTKEFLEDIKTRHPKIMTEQMIVSHTKIKTLYKSTTGNEYNTEKGAYGVSVMYSAHEVEKSSSFNGSDATFCDLDRPFIELAMFEQDFKDIERQIETVPVKGKFVGKVVFTPACLAGIIWSICGNFASDGVLLDGTSIWKDKLSQKVADERINVSFRPHDKRIVCGQNYTSEGYIAEDFDFIKNGVLESFLLSRYVANKTGLPMAKNSSSSMIIENGRTPVADIIKSIDKGIIVGRFSGGQPGTNGEFSGVAKNSFLIENGKIVSATSETMISGNLADMLNNLYDISKETLEDGDISLPYMAFDGITVSGK